MALFPGAEEQIKQIETGARALIISSLVTAVAVVIILVLIWKKWQ